MKQILTLNNISPAIGGVFDGQFSVSADCAAPDGILVRSFGMHDYALPESVLAVARAGAGTNNIPAQAYAEKGVVVFNTPGANANAVKELVIAALLLGNLGFEQLGIPFADIMVYAALLLTVWSGIDYIVRNRALFKNTNKV